MLEAYFVAYRKLFAQEAVECRLYRWQKRCYAVFSIQFDCGDNGLLLIYARFREIDAYEKVVGRYFSVVWVPA